MTKYVVLVYTNYSLYKALTKYVYLGHLGLR
jgi:hypothetical protein